MSKLDELKKYTVVVSDTGDFEAIKQYHPRDATTNPSLIYSAAQKPQYAHLIDEAIDFGNKMAPRGEDPLPLIIDRLTVNFGLEILKLVPGRVSTEVDARLSFDIEGSIAKAKRLISFYKDAGIDPKRVLIKLASTWEGIRAAKQLEQEGIHCNLTLMFSLPQAIACAEAKVTLISPFVGRIFDWYKAHDKVESYPPEKDPGVLSVTQIYHYYKKFGYKTEIMGASFRNTDQILELAGCDLLTISPELLDQLQKTEGAVPQKLHPETAKKDPVQQQHMDEKTFRFQFNENPMAVDKLAEGIRKFSADLRKLESFVKERRERRK